MLLALLLGCVWIDDADRAYRDCLGGGSSDAPFDVLSVEPTSAELAGGSVTLTRGYRIGATEVTEEGSDAPRRAVSWHGAASYANQISDDQGLEACYTCQDDVCEPVADLLGCEGWRLPTEAEWEIAARAGETGDYLGGDRVDESETGCDEVELTGGGWVSDSTRYCVDGEEGPDDVASREPNAWGGFDFTGNVWEWVEDGYQETQASGTDPIGDGAYGTIRGGAFASAAEWVTLSSRYEQDRTYDGTNADLDPEGPDLGFRLARTWPEGAGADCE